MSILNDGIATEMNRGFLQILTLLLLRSDKYGYQLIRSVEDAGYSADENTFYPLLRRLEKNGWVTSRWDVQQDRPKKYYKITDAGNDALQQFLSIWDLQNSILSTIREEALQ